MLFGNKILDYWDDILRDLATVIAIPSVATPTEGPHPFGDNCAKALDTVLGLAESYGLKTKNVDYYAGHAEYGEGPENAVVMAHIDVVPAGEGWETDPFTMVIDGNKAYGRGVADDKGAAIVALHCLRALKDAGVPAKRKLRVIFGSAEEIGMADMGHYFEQEQHPDMGFTPDSGYGICHCEKGILNFEISCKNDSPVIRSFSAGIVPNAVPSKAVCQVACTPAETEALCRAAEKSEIDISVAALSGGASLLATGKASHGAFPQGGKNAASYLIQLLGEVFGDRIGTFFRFARDKIGLTYDGSRIGVAMSDEASGPLTFNLGIVQADAQECRLVVDIRYPATKKGADIIAVLEKAAEENGVAFTLLSDAKPMYLPKESKLITLLSGAYRDVTGEECTIFAMGGGTYARQMFDKGVAFGPGFPQDGDSHEHDVGECINLDSLKLHAQICLESMYRMLTAD